MRRRFWAADCETDPFLENRVPQPFIWGIFTGREDFTFEGPNCTEQFVRFIAEKEVILYVHNGGKYDFMYLLEYLEKTRVKIIGSRLVEIRIGKAILRDSYSIIPTPLSAFQKTNFDYTKMEATVRHKYMPEIRSYLKDDCHDLYSIVKAFREKAGGGLTIAGNALTMARQMKIDPGRTTKKQDEIFRPFFFGGRCQAFDAGHFEKVDIFDIKSAYPFAMMYSHPIGKEYTLHSNGQILPERRLKNSFLEVECYSKGAFPKRSKHRLEFPHAYDLYNISGWEFATALKYGLIDRSRQLKIHKTYEFINSITFKPYIDYWFNEKEIADSRGDKANRHVAKIMLNSLYGKFAQNPVRYKDYKLMHAGSKLIDGWELGPEFGNSEWHIRDSMYSLKQKYGEQWEEQPIFYNVATAASITGFVRAMLLQAMAAVGPDRVLYCDTDSLFVRNGNYEKLRRDGALGAWEWEGRANDCYIGGRKMYVAYINDKVKSASKGARLTNKEIERVCMGETIKWHNNAPTFAIDGRPTFIVRRLSRTVDPKSQ